MRAFRRGLLVAVVAAGVSMVVRVRGRGVPPQSGGGWRQLQGPDLR